MKYTIFNKVTGDDVTKDVVINDGKIYHDWRAFEDGIDDDWGRYLIFWEVKL